MEDADAEHTTRWTLESSAVHRDGGGRGGRRPAARRGRRPGRPVGAAASRPSTPGDVRRLAVRQDLRPDRQAVRGRLGRQGQSGHRAQRRAAGRQADRDVRRRRYGRRLAVADAIPGELHRAGHGPADRRPARRRAVRARLHAVHAGDCSARRQDVGPAVLLDGVDLHVQRRAADQGRVQGQALSQLPGAGRPGAQGQARRCGQVPDPVDRGPGIRAAARHVVQSHVQPRWRHLRSAAGASARRGLRRAGDAALVAGHVQGRAGRSELAQPAIHPGRQSVQRRAARLPRHAAPLLRQPDQRRRAVADRRQGACARSPGRRQDDRVHHALHPHRQYQGPRVGVEAAALSRRQDEDRRLHAGQPPRHRRDARQRLPVGHGQRAVAQGLVEVGRRAHDPVRLERRDELRRGRAGGLPAVVSALERHDERRADGVPAGEGDGRPGVRQHGRRRREGQASLSFFLRRREPTAGVLALLMNAPSGLWLALILAWPVLYAGWLSLHEVSIRQLRTGEFPFAGAANYVRLFRDDVFWLALSHTVVFVAISVALEVVIALAIALVINDERVWLSRVTRGLLLVPWGVPPVVNGLLWSFIFNAQYGYLNRALLALGLIAEHVNWLGDSRLAMGAVITAYVWRTTPFNILLYHAGLQGIPRDYYEAAEVDGASGWSRFWRITLPLLRPVIAVSLILRTAGAVVAGESRRHRISGGTAGPGRAGQPSVREGDPARRPRAAPARDHPRELPAHPLRRRDAGPHLRASDVPAEVGRSLPDGVRQQPDRRVRGDAPHAGAGKLVRLHGGAPERPVGEGDALAVGGEPAGAVDRADGAALRPVPDVRAAQLPGGRRDRRGGIPGPVRRADPGAVSRLAAGGARGRRAHRRLHALRRLPADRAAAGHAGAGRVRHHHVHPVVARAADPAHRGQPARGHDGAGGPRGARLRLLRLLHADDGHLPARPGAYAPARRRAPEVRRPRARQRSAQGMSVRFGLVGYGLWGRHHALAITRAPGATLAAIACRSEVTAADARRDFPSLTVHLDYHAQLAH